MIVVGIIGGWLLLIGMIALPIYLVGRLTRIRVVCKSCTTKLSPEDVTIAVRDIKREPRTYRNHWGEIVKGKKYSCSYYITAKCPQCGKQHQRIAKNYDLLDTVDDKYWESKEEVFDRVIRIAKMRAPKDFFKEADPKVVGLDSFLKQFKSSRK